MGQSGGDNRWPSDSSKIKKIRWIFIVSILTIILFSTAVIILANHRNKQLYKLLDTYPGDRPLYLGHDLSTGFSAFGIALGIFAIVFYVFYDDFDKSEEEKGNSQPVIQVFLVFGFIILSVLLLSAGLVVLWSANAQNGMDEHKWADDYPLAWKHSSSWDWMTQTLYYNYDNLWRDLMSENQCCGVRGHHELKAIRALWNNKSDIFSSFNTGLNGNLLGENICCKERAVGEDETQWTFNCVTGKIFHEEGCYWKVAWWEFIPLGSILIGLAAFSMCVSVLGSYFHIMQRDFPAFFSNCQ